jgi:hypothetical protein
MKVGKQSFNIEALKDVDKKEFLKLVNERACKKKPLEVWKMLQLELKKKG